MTQGERRLVIGVFGWVEVLAGIVNVVTWLVTGEFSRALTVLVALVVLSSGPFVVPALWQDLNDHKLPIEKTDGPGNAGEPT
jgi:hypothetical protein